MKRKKERMTEEIHMDNIPNEIHLYFGFSIVSLLLVVNNLLYISIGWNG